MSEDNAIIAENVYKRFGDVKALDGVSIAAERGKILGLLGPNGAGKTTLVRILTTLLKPDSGNTQVGGLDVLRQKQQVREIIGLAGQNTAIDEILTGRENLEMVSRLYHIPRPAAKRRAQELLEQFALTDAADRQAKTYSGGMRRRLDLAASIVARPSILFLDEPTTGLDPRTRITMWDTIRSLVSDGATLLLTTQYLEEADVLADKIVVIDHGKVIAEGTADELKANMAADFIDITVADPHETGKAVELLRPLSDESPQTDEGRGHISLAVGSGAQSIAEVVRLLDADSVRIAELNLRRPSLNDVFLSITGEEIVEEETKPKHRGFGRRRSA
ncbi:MAG: ATP-binding cassette domain-containing protein [Chloroflexota bacterium]|nr:ATP-binding cassette domain-containing protein [Chloroflexota bacterium]MDE2908117.1 ATP-binding cassette domain-containing protein [Chloroflexota bacterium]